MTTKKFIKQSEEVLDSLLDQRKNILLFLAGFATGSLFTYYFDPTRGTSRRALLRDKMVKIKNQGNYYGGKLYRNVRNQSRGMVAKVSHLRQGKEEEVDDQILVQRVRSEFGRKIKHAKSIKVVANQGEVTLSGPILKDEVNAILRSVSHVHGVKNVINNMDVHTEAGKISSLQGEGKEYLR